MGEMVLFSLWTTASLPGLCNFGVELIKYNLGHFPSISIFIAKSCKNFIKIGKGDVLARSSTVPFHSQG